MRKILAILLTAAMLLTAVGCGGNNAPPASGADSGSSGEAPSASGSNKLVLYTATAEENLQVMIPAFEEATGIQVDVITAGTGEVYARIQAEKENPACDVTWIGGYYAMQDPTLWEPYVSAHNEELPADYQTTDGIINMVNRVASVIIYNKDLVPFEIKGYADLLRPELKGKIAHGDAVKSGSAYNHLENMLVDFGGGDVFSDKGWEYVEQFLGQLDGRIIDSSGTIHKGVVSGEYAVGLTWDTPAQTYLSQDVQNVEVVMMEEGVVNTVSGICIIKNAPNLENAKKFVDFMTSKEGQSLLGTDVPGANPIRTDVELAPYKVSLNDIKGFVIDPLESAANKEKILERYQELYLKIFE